MINVEIERRRKDEKKEEKKNWIKYLWKLNFFFFLFFFYKYYERLNQGSIQKDEKVKKFTTSICKLMFANFIHKIKSIFILKEKKSIYTTTKKMKEYTSLYRYLHENRILCQVSLREMRMWVCIRDEIPNTFFLCCFV